MHIECLRSQYVFIVKQINICYNKTKKKRKELVLVSYKKLWKLLIDKDMKKQDLMAITGISASTVQKLNKGENVNTDILVRICNALNRNVSDIMDIHPKKDGQ